jgi:hypothetical protein
MSVVYCEGVGWASLLAFWTNDIGEDGVDISVSGGGGVSEFDPFDAEQGHTALAIGVTQRHVIGGANAIMGVSADPAVFAMPAVPGTMGHTAEPVDFTQNHILPAVAGEMGHTATVAAQGVVIAALNAIQGHTADAVTDIEEFQGAMVVGNPDQGHTATPIILVKNLVNVNTSQGHEADTGDIHENKIIPVAGTMGHEAGRIN